MVPMFQMWAILETRTLLQLWVAAEEDYPVGRWIPKEG